MIQACISGPTVCLWQFSISNIILVNRNDDTSTVECLGHHLGCNGPHTGLKVKSSRICRSPLLTIAQSTIFAGFPTIVYW